VWRLHWQARLAAPPAAFSAHVWDSMRIDDFGGQRWPVLRFGIDEDFEGQPFALTEPVRGLTGHGLKLTRERARSGSQALVIDQLPATADGESIGKGRYTARGAFLHLPQVELQPNSRYRFRAWILAEGDGTRARLTADTYEWTPHDDARLSRQESPWIDAGAEWRETALEVVTGALDPSLDLRFQGVGPGRVFIDDCRFERLGPATP
jgi:hypothetical protein